MSVLTAYRQCRVDYFPFIDDFTARKGEEAVNREALLEVLTDFLKANNLNERADRLSAMQGGLLSLHRRFHRAQGRGSGQPRGVARSADGFSESQQSK